MASNGDSLLIPGKQLARLLNIGESTFHRWVACGRVGPRPLRFGRTTRYRLDEVQEWLASADPDGNLPNREQWDVLRSRQLRRNGR